MNARYEIVDRYGIRRQTIRFTSEAPPKAVSAVVSVLLATKKKLQYIFGENFVRLYLEAFEPSVFWGLVFFRPLYIHDKKTNLFEFLKTGTPEDLQKMDLGVMYDKENQFVCVDWVEARAGRGILSHLEECPTWARLMRAVQKRTGEAPRWEYKKECADAHSWVMPHWELRKKSYITKKLWFWPKRGYDDVSVFWLPGLLIVQRETENLVLTDEARLARPYRVKFMHHYTNDREEYRKMVRARRKLDRAERAAQMTDMERAQRNELVRMKRQTERAELREEKEWMFQAARIIGPLPRALGKGTRGRYPPMMTYGENARRFRFVLDAYVNGELVRPQWGTVERLLDQLEELLKNPLVLPEYGDWLIWRNRGKNVDAYLARLRNGNTVTQRQGPESEASLLPPLRWGK